MQTKHNCVLIHIWTKGWLAPWNRFQLFSKTIFTDRSKAVLLLWIVSVSYVSCWCVLYCRVYSLYHCGHLLGKGWPLGCHVCCVLSLSQMCPSPHKNKGRGWRRETGLSPPVKYFTGRSKAVLLLWIICVIFVLCLSCVRFCSLQTCGHLLGKG